MKGEINKSALPEIANKPLCQYLIQCAATTSVCKDGQEPHSAIHQRHPIDVHGTLTQQGQSSILLKFPRDIPPDSSPSVHKTSLTDLKG